MKVSTTVQYKDDKEYEAINETGNTVSIDMLDAANKKAMSPTELLLTAVAACAMVDIAIMLKKRRKTLVDLKGVASGSRKEEHPRAFTDIHVNFTVVSPDATDEELERIVDLAVNNYCSVASTLRERPKLTHGFEVVKN